MTVSLDSTAWTVTYHQVSVAVKQFRDLLVMFMSMKLLYLSISIYLIVQSAALCVCAIIDLDLCIVHSKCIGVSENKAELNLDRARRTTTIVQRYLFLGIFF